MKNSHCLIFAHRGASAYVSGNTLEAFELAILQGADFIEIDIRQTKEGIPVITHSKYVRKGLRSYRISKLTLEELQHFNNDIITLDEAFDQFVGRVSIDLDIKEMWNFDSLVGLLGKYNIKEDQVMLNCNKLKAIEYFRSVLPNHRYVLSYAFSSSVDLNKRKFMQTLVASLSKGVKWILPQRFKRNAVNSGVYGVSLPYTLVYKGLVDYFHRNGINVYAWPPNGEKTLKKLVDIGVDGIKTGRPDVLVRLLEKTCSS